MSHGLDSVETETPAAPQPGAAGFVDRAVEFVNYGIVIVSSVALVAASIVLTYSVLSRHFFHFSTDWQDELSVFLIVGAVFMSAAAIQARRGHIGIEAIASLLSARANRVRLLFVDIISLAFCGYFTWKSWTLLQEAWMENYHSGSTWGPPLWIPYSLMSLGMTLLCMQLLLQVIGFFRRQVPPQ